jgi:uncharacterized membrane protein (UPF0182 family)
MYVEPVFVRATEGAAYPTLQKVIVSFGNEIAIENTYPEALAFFFEQIDTGGGGGNGNGGGGNGGGGNGGGGNQGEPGSGDAQQRLTDALEDAAAAYADGQAALAEGDFAAYGEAQQALESAINRATEAAAELGLPAPTEPPPDETSAASASLSGARIPIWR